MRADIAIIAALLALLFAGSCEQVISLDKGLANAEGSTDKEGEFDGATGGNPAEDIAEGPDSPDNQATADSTASADGTVSDADTATPNSDDSWNEDGTADESSYSDADNGVAPDTMADSSVSDEDAYDGMDDTVSADSDPTASLTPEDCGCGENPEYAPICCDGVTTVFNTCFANCLNVNSGQCATQQTGTCASQGGENDADADTEVSDDDTINVGSCGCIPTDMNAWCCDGGTRYISECTATCECEGTAVFCD